MPEAKSNTYTRENQYLGQKFKTEIKIIQMEPQEPGTTLYISVEVQQTKARPFQSLDIEPLHADIPFIPTGTYSGYRVNLDGQVIEKGRVAHRMRPLFREAVNGALGNMWSYWMAAPTHPDDEIRQNLRESFEQFMRSASSRDFMDQINDWLVSIINDFFQDWECPDDDDECMYMHWLSLPHAELWTGDVIPEKYAYRYTVDGSIVWTSAFNWPEGSSWAEYLRVNEIEDCSNCGEYTNDIEEVGEGQAWCGSCLERLMFCERCDSPTDREDAVTTTEWDNDYEEEVTIILCFPCHQRDQRLLDSTRLALHNYSYKPDPIFFSSRDEEDPTRFFGMELEVSRTHYDNREANRWIKEVEEEGFLYCKSDSSVSGGFEIVTHPFTYQWSVESFPYELFETLLQIKGVLPSHDSAGTHIHISKDGFSSPHLWKFIKFHMDVPDFAGIVGERGASPSYGSLKRDTEILKAELMGVALQKGKNGNLLGMSRSVGINLIPEKTIELRYLAGNVKPEGIKKNIQWVEAVLRFTDLVSVTNVQKGALKDPGYFLGWLEDQSEFEVLMDFMTGAFPTPKKLEV